MKNVFEAFWVCLCGIAIFVLALFINHALETVWKGVFEFKTAVTEQGDCIGSLQHAVKQLQIETMAAQQARVKELDSANITTPTPTPPPMLYARPLTEEEKEFFEKMPNGGWYMGETELFQNMFSTPTPTPVKFNIPCATQGFTIEEYHEYLKHLPTATSTPVPYNKWRRGIGAVNGLRIGTESMSICAQHQL